MSSSTPGPFNAGDQVSFDIKIYNQGTIDANNVMLQIMSQQD
ncbi:MAG: hypothetical protein IPL98_13850 [Saprospiraceae bacterium]|nr:hypothetical protein [Saprospiraceae bacterium]